MLARFTMTEYLKNIWLTCLLTGICFLIPSVVMAQVMFLEPPEIASPDVGKALAISVKIKEVKNLVGVQFDLTYDGTALEFKKVTTGDFLGKNAFSTIPNLIKLTPGRLKGAAITKLGAKVGAEGEGALADIQFTVLVVKVSEIKLDAVKALEPDNKEIKVTLQGCKITVPPSTVKSTGKLPAIWGKIKAGN